MGWIYNRRNNFQNRGGSEMNTYTKNQLDDILKKHKKWLYSEKGGEKANLSSADLSSAVTDKKYLQISCIGSRKGITTYCIEDNEILCGCWKSSLEDFEKRVHEIYKDGLFRKEYDGAIAYFKLFKEEVK